MNIEKLESILKLLIVKDTVSIKEYHYVLENAEMLLRGLQKLNDDSLEQEVRYPADKDIAIDTISAIETIKKHYPTSNYKMLREALDTAIKVLGDHEQLEQQNKAYEEALKRISENTWHEEVRIIAKVALKHLSHIK